MTLSGVINLDKPPGISSARAVARVKRLLPRGTKIGHAGTLDPFATGILLLLVGRATRLCESLMSCPKQYDATIRFGATTATDDPESPPEPWPGATPITLPDVQNALPAFTGPVMQAPPVFSAMKVAGRRAYDLARKGHDVTLPPRPVRIDRIDILSFDWPVLRLRIDCGRGTYIRAIARDLGRHLAVGGYLTQLQRTRVGPFDLRHAVTLEQLAAAGVEANMTPLHAVRLPDPAAEPHPPASPPSN